MVSFHTIFPSEGAGHNSFPFGAPSGKRKFCLLRQATKDAVFGKPQAFWKRLDRKPLRPFNKKSPEAAGENSLFVILGTGIDGTGTVDLLTQQHTGKLVRKGETGEADPACGGRLDLWG